MFRILLFFIVSLSFVQVTLAQKSFHYPELKLANEEKINTPVLEFSPSFYEDGILFISTMSAGKKKQGYDKKIKKPTMSIFLAKRNDITGALERPIPFALELTTKMHEGPLTFDRNAEKVYFTRNDLNKRRRKTAKLKIYESIKSEDGQWSLPVELPFNLDDFETAHPSISADGNTLVFSSNREGGFGGMDLYVSTQEGGVWSDPINLGERINTPKNEIFPFLHADKSLFFSSDGHLGEGGLDLYYTIIDEDDMYAAPVNLGVPFNSEMDDLGIILDRDKKNGYFSSNRTDGIGDDDIYAFSFDQGDIDEYFYFNNRVPDVLEPMTFSVSDKISNAPIANMNVTILPLNDPIVDTSMLSRNRNGQIALLAQTGTRNNYQILQEKMDAKGRKGVTDSTGRLNILLPKGYYTVLVDKTDFSNQFAIVNTNISDVNFYTNEALGCTPVIGKVIDERSQGIPDVMVKMIDSKGELVTSVKTNDNGEFEACAKCQRFYEFEVEMSGTVIGQAELDTKNVPCENANTFKLMIPVGDVEVTMKEGTIIELKNLYFNFNDAAIRLNARQDLDELVEVLNKYPDMEIEIASYTDAVGGTDYNLGISQKRADKVVDYLVSKGINDRRLLGVGYGESGIRNHCVNGVKCSDREHQYNRRIEIKVTKTSVPVKVTYSDDGPPIVEKYNSHKAKSYPGTAEDANLYGSFHVVLGAYLMARNAERKANTVKAMGFEETSITSFSNSPAYHSVVVKTFYDYNEALQFAEMLRDEHGLEFYIKKML